MESKITKKGKKGKVSNLSKKKRYTELQKKRKYVETEVEDDSLQPSSSNINLPESDNDSISSDVSQQLQFEALGPEMSETDMPSTSGGITRLRPRKSLRPGLDIAPVESGSSDEKLQDMPTYLQFSDARVDLSSTSESDSRSSPSNYVPTPLKVYEKKATFATPEDEIRSIDMQMLKMVHRKEQLVQALSVVQSTVDINVPVSDSSEDSSEMVNQNCLFIGETRKLEQLLDSVNRLRNCSTKYCRGKLVPVKIQTSRQGCGVICEWSCDGCQQGHLIFDSTLIEGSRRSVVSLSACVAFIISGCLYADYRKVTRLGLGMDSLGPSSFFEVIKMLHPHVEALLNDQCNAAKDAMKAMDQTAIGSWNRGVTSSDGVWLTRGFFSKNFSFTVWNYMNSALLYFRHLSQRGTDNVIEEGLYGGTSKAAEGYAAEETFALAKEEGFNIEVNWQDADSSSANGFLKAYPEHEGSSVMLCGGHVNRAITKSLKEKMKLKSFSQAYKTKHRVEFPQVDTVECECRKGNHKKNCGCIKEPFITQARVNFFCALLEAGNSPTKFRDILVELAEHHCKDEHEWEGGHCSFHPLRVCSCGNCQDPKNLQCAGDKYSSRLKVTCPLHQLMYEKEVKERANQADKVIHKELGKGHSNIPESAHNILIHFRSKNWNIHRLHYFVATNLGLLEANAVFCYNHYGPNYSWIAELYERLSLPVFPNLIAEFSKHINQKLKRREFTTSEKYRPYKTLQKMARVLEQQERKKWLNAQSMTEHNYGLQGDEDEDIEDIDGAQDVVIEESVSGNVKNTFVSENIEVLDSEGIVGKKSDVCKCGSTSHKRTSHKSCPLRKR